MKPELPLDEASERFIDEELRAVFDVTPIDLRAKVLQAIDEGRGTRDEGRGIFQPRWAFAFAAAAVLVLAVVLTWRGSAMRPGRDAVNAERAPLTSTPIATAAWVEPSSAPGVRLVNEASAHRATPLLTWDRTPVVADAGMTSSEPYMPGAPAGDLGDPLQPMPSPPPISFAPIGSAPIATAPPVSQFARPVTDFPADNQPPAADSGNAGPSGGTRR